MYINFLSELLLTPKISLVVVHKNNHICNIPYTSWETLEKFRFTLPHFPLLVLHNCNLYQGMQNILGSHLQILGAVMCYH